MTDAAEKVTVVLGAGSPLMGDDGLGVEVVETLSERWAESATLRFLDGGVWGMRLLPHIEEADRLLLIDAIRAGEQPGTLVRLERSEIPRQMATKLSVHQVDLGEVFAVAELRGRFPVEAVAIGVEPERVEAYVPISGAVRARVPELVEAIEEQLRTWGHALEPREATSRA